MFEFLNKVQIYETMNEERGAVLQGRPDKRDLVIEYIQANPKASISQISKDLGISRTTVYKYRNEV